MDMRRAVEFAIRLSDLRKANKHLLVNRGGFKQTDCADLLVSQCIATFRSVGTELEVPVEGIQPGAVRIPLRTLDDVVKKVVPTFKSSELKLHFEQSTVKVETFTLRHPDISLGIFPSQRFDLPADAGVLDTLAMAHLLSPEMIADQGLRERVEAAQRRTSEAVSNAEAALREFGISRGRIQELVDIQVNDAAEKLRAIIYGQR